MDEMTTSYLAVFRWFPPTPHYWIDARGEWHEGRERSDDASLANREGE